MFEYNVFYKIATSVGYIEAENYIRKEVIERYEEGILKVINAKMSGKITEVAADQFIKTLNDGLKRDMRKILNIAAGLLQNENIDLAEFLIWIYRDCTKILVD